MRPLVCTTLLLLGCTTTATISTRTLGTIEAGITGGDEKHLFVTTEGGLVRAVPRTEVTGIDHPGNPLVLTGGLLAGGGGLDLMIMSGSCGADVRVCVPYAITTAVGVGLLTWGLWVWLGSRFAVDPPPNTPPVVVQEPVVLPPPPPTPLLAPPQNPALSPPPMPPAAPEAAPQI